MQLGLHGLAGVANALFCLRISNNDEVPRLLIRARRRMTPCLKDALECVCWNRFRPEVASALAGKNRG